MSIHRTNSTLSRRESSTAKESDNEFFENSPSKAKEGGVEHVEHAPPLPQPKETEGQNQLIEHTPRETVPVGALYPNRWYQFREHIREPMAEFLGVCILIIFGTGVDCQVVLSTNTAVSASPKGDYLSLNFGWAVGTAMGVWVSGGISGGHINPAITIALATFRGFPWKKVPIYILSQVLGGLVGAAVVYGNYFHAIDLFEGGPGVRTLKTASLFSTYSMDYMTNVSAFFDEFLGTAVLTIVVLAMNDKKNLEPPAGLTPLVLFMLVLGIGAALGMQTGYAINPARDLGPRLMTAMAGWGSQVFTFRNQYWIWCPIMGPFVGALFGAAFYDAFLFTGDESFFNRPNKKAMMANFHGHHEQRRHMPAGPGVDDRVDEMV